MRVSLPNPSISHVNRTTCAFPHLGASGQTRINPRVFEYKCPRQPLAKILSEYVRQSSRFMVGSADENTVFEAELVYVLLET